MSHRQDDQRINHVVHQIIKNNSNKSLQKLKRENESKIIKSIKLKHRAQFLDILSKRDHYINKLNKFVDECIDENIDTTKAISIPINNYKGPDPAHITNLHHAKAYVEEQIAKDHKMVTKIQGLISKHFQFQNEYEYKRRAISDKRILQRVPLKLDKLLRVNDKVLQENELQRQNEMQKELNDFDRQIMKASKKLYQESLELLKLWNVPFFCMLENLEYPDCERDKVDLLNYMVELFNPTRLN
ncbi:uncharacterized protein PRCAT00005593001 [Priceomyces carsonii]|uniref:uncharacterized protein n=1 Tax=Priceomyces carsonii TaxID=28549 RepID=UPI002ED78889|nr:unnamed protein product [Priceomyces carsonii]